MLKRVSVSDPKLRAMAEHFALEDGGQTLPQAGHASMFCLCSVEDFQTWRRCWDNLVSLIVIDLEMKKELEERMARMVMLKMF